MSLPSAGKVAEHYSTAICQPIELRHLPTHPEPSSMVSSEVLFHHHLADLPRYHELQITPILSLFLGDLVPLSDCISCEY